MPPLAIHEPGEMTSGDWTDLLDSMDAEDRAAEQRVRRHEVTETDLGVPLTVIEDGLDAPRTVRNRRYEGERAHRYRNPWNPDGLLPEHRSKRRYVFPNVIGMTGNWFGPMHFWQGKDGIIFDCRDEPCAGCGGAELSSGTICARCDRTGLDSLIEPVTVEERRTDSRKYKPTPGVKGGKA
jgi:hypothetical protein